jgi:hypothetical protein
MTTKTGMTVTSSIGGQLRGYGAAIIWCGSCGCDGSTATKSFDLGTVGAGTYTASPVAVRGDCNVKANGEWGVHVSFNGQRLRNPVDGGEWIYAPTNFYLELVESAIDGNVACDCLNGGCIPKTTYNTPGVYASLAACQSGCAKNSNCTGECISTGELAALQQAANNLQTKFCG